MTDAETAGAGAAEGQDTNVSTGVAANPPSTATTIQAPLPHPVMSQPLPRGASYLHHFEVELISDGHKLVAALSAEGKKLLADIRGDKAAAANAVDAHKAALADPATDAAKPVPNTAAN